MSRVSSLADLVADWHPDDRVAEDTIDSRPVAGLSSVLGYGEPIARDRDDLPPLWHWLYFLDWPAPQHLGPDGHPLAGDFLPPIRDRRRMIAGGRVEIREPLEVGRTAQRSSSLADVQVKNGRSGEMVFVTVRYELRQSGRLRVVEEHDVVYRSGESSPAAPVVPDHWGTPAVDAAWQHAWRPDPVLLFRFSALTHNSHRIHYDEPYCRDVENYPGLVVHGPLLILLMLASVRAESHRAVEHIAYRLHRPVFAGEQFVAAGAPDPEDSDAAQLWIASRREQQNATASVRFAKEG